MTFHKKRTKCQCFRRRPVNALSGRNNFFLGLELACDLAVNVEAFRYSGQSLPDFVQHIRLDTRIAATGIITLHSTQVRPSPFEPVRLIGLEALTCIKLFFQMIPHGLTHSFDLIHLQQAFDNQTFAIKLANATLPGNLLVHQRLGERWLVTFIVTKAAITEHINHDILVEGLTEFCCHACNVNPRLRDRPRSHGKSAPE